MDVVSRKAAALSALDRSAYSARTSILIGRLPLENQTLTELAIDAEP
jgi:hypothetical protein